MWHIASWWLRNLFWVFYWAFSVPLLVIVTSNYSPFIVKCLFLGIFIIGFLSILISFYQKIKNIKDFLSEQENNIDDQFQIYPIITKEQLLKGVFKYKISCKDFSPYSFHSQLYAQESLEIL